MIYGVPLEGCGYKFSHLVFWIKLSKKKKGVCNKCEDKLESKKKDKK